jgi:hypothetical protein
MTIAQDTNDLLLPFEEKLFPKEYKHYLETRRHNYANCIQAIPGLWDLYMSLDQIWIRAIGDIRTARDPSQMLPGVVYINAHIKIRIGMELAFSASMEESRSILRDAVEWTATAHYLLSDPELQRVWLRKNEDPEAYDRAFKHDKKEKLFKGLGQLHRYWCDFSETGAHANLNATCNRIQVINTDHHVEFRTRYTGVEEKLWVMEIFCWLDVCSMMEATMSMDYKTRLQFDEQLVQMRARFQCQKEEMRRKIKVRYNVQNPAGFKPPWRR